MKNTFKDNLSTNSDTDTFLLSSVRSSTPLNKHVTFDNDKLMIVRNHHFDAKVNFIGMNGLLDLESFVGKISPYTALVPGCPHRNFELVETAELEWEIPLDDDGHEDRYLSSREFFQFYPIAPSLMRIDVDASNDTPESAWEKLCTIDPALKTVGRLVTHSELSHIRNERTGELLTGADRFHIYCLVADGLDIARYACALHIRSAIKGFDKIEYTERDEYHFKSFVRLPVCYPDEFILESPPTLAKGLVQEKPPIQAYPGEILDTHKFSDPDIHEEYAYANNTIDALMQYPQLYQRVAHSNEIENFRTSVKNRSWITQYYVSNDHPEL